MSSHTNELDSPTPESTATRSACVSSNQPWHHLQLLASIVSTSNVSSSLIQILSHSLTREQQTRPLVHDSLAHSLISPLGMRNSQSFLSLPFILFGFARICFHSHSLSLSWQAGRRDEDKNKQANSVVQLDRRASVVRLIGTLDKRAAFFRPLARF